MMDDDSDEVVKKTGKVKADDYIGAGDLHFDNAPVRCHGATCAAEALSKRLKRSCAGREEVEAGSVAPARG